MLNYYIKANKSSVKPRGSPCRGKWWLSKTNLHHSNSQMLPLLLPRSCEVRRGSWQIQAQAWGHWHDQQGWTWDKGKWSYGNMWVNLKFSQSMCRLVNALLRVSTTHFARTSRPILQTRWENSKLNSSLRFRNTRDLVNENEMFTKTEQRNKFCMTLTYRVFESRKG